MPIFLSVAEIIGILHSGDFNRLLGGLEDEHLECKSAPYQLNQEPQKMELAKDISALANADGGIILIGVQTEEEPTSQGEIIRHIGCLAQASVSLGQYENVSADWIVPSIPGLKFQWHPSAANPLEGIVSVFVPQAASQEKPYLVAKLVTGAGRVVGSYVGYFERTRDSVAPTKPTELRQRLKDGLRFAELSGRLENIEEMIARVTANPTPEQPPLSNEEILRRVQKARRAVGYEGKPALTLAAWPLQHAEFPNLFESHDVPVVRLLENPPRLRQAGFDLSTRRASTIIEAQLRRSLIPDRKLIEVWRDGALIVVQPGDSSHLCWGMNSDLEDGWRINSLALVETVYLFCDWTLATYEVAVPPPTTFRIRIMLSDMIGGGKPFKLPPHRPSPYFIGEGERPSPPGQAGVWVETTPINRVGAVAGALAYQLLADFYAWFGFDSTDIPFASREEQSPVIDPVQLRNV